MNFMGCLRTDVETLANQRLNLLAENVKMIRYYLCSEQIGQSSCGLHCFESDIIISYQFDSCSGAKMGGP